MVGKFTTDTFGLLPHDDSSSYSHRVKSSTYWPFNLKSGSIATGYNSIVDSAYNQNPLVIVNLHSDTTDITNEIPMQGTFTQTHVGGHQGRHVNLNKHDTSLVTEGGGAPANNIDDQYTRPEAYRLLVGDNPFNTFTPDGALGLTGPDYGLPYPNTSRQWAIYYREERSKRPVNIKNIGTTTGSSVHGNFQHQTEFLSTFGSQRILLRDAEGSLLPATTVASLPQTTNYMTLVSQAPFPLGNVFGPANNNRQPDTGSYDQTIIEQAKGVWTIETTDAGAQPQNYHNGNITIVRNGSPTIDNIAFTFKNSGFSNGDVISSGPPKNIAVQTVTDDWFSTVKNWINAFNGANAFGGNTGVTSLTASVGPFTAGSNLYTITIQEVEQIATAGNGGGITAGAGLTRIGSPGSPGFTGGSTSIQKYYANDIVREIPRTDLTSSKNIIINRFSAPGGPEINSRGYLDVANGEYSVYNSINYRNLSIRGNGSGEATTIRVNSHASRREALRTLRARHQGQFGIDSTYGKVSTSDYVSEASFHKEHRNSLTTPRISKTFFRNAVFAPSGSSEQSMRVKNESPYGYPQSGGLSFNFWLKFDKLSGQEQYVFNTHQ